MRNACPYTPLVLLIFIIITLLTPSGVQASEEGYSGSRDEIRMLKLLREEKFIKAREIAEMILLIDSNSYTANFTMGVIVGTAETNLPKAYFYLQRAKDSYEGQYGSIPDDDKTWRWHADILSFLIEITAGLELYQKQIEYLRAYDASYVPRKTPYYAWPLMKMGRISESRKIIQKALKESRNVHDRSVALNTLGAIEMELDNRDEAYRVYREILKNAKNSEGYITEKYNFAIAAHTLGRFDEAEKALIDAASDRSSPYDVANPWESLAYYYTFEGRFNEAYGALRNMIQWGLHRVAYMDQQCISEENATKAKFLLACGYPEQAYSITKRLVERPDRQGYSSSRQYTSMGGSIQLHLAALDDYMKVLQERLIWAGLGEKPGIVWTIKSMEAEKKLQKSRLKAIIMNNRALYYTLIPNHPLGIEVDEFQKPDLIDVVGKGLIGADIINIRKHYRYREIAEPYIKELEGEIAFKSRDRKRAMACFMEAQEKLPPAEKLLNARIYVLTGRLREDLGEIDAALALYQKAYQICPSLFRHFDIRLPVAIRVEGGDPSLAEIGKYLRKSPRFRMQQGAFQIDVKVSGNRITGDLLDNFGNRTCTASTVKTGDKHKDASLFLDELHIKAFTAPISASFSEINSLDGTNIKDDELRESIRDLLFDRKKN
ncbi:MAG: hypothetical protein AB2L14_01920 [Candidatus Xenobiia bacterium LiM19]